MLAFQPGTNYYPGKHIVYRKLTAIVSLTDKSEYEGGELTFIDYHGRNIKAPKEKGTMIVFDSRIPHKVSRIKKGSRTSLVTWMYGPSFK